MKFYADCTYLVHSSLIIELWFSHNKKSKDHVLSKIILYYLCVLSKAKFSLIRRDVLNFFQWILMILQCDAIRSEQLENGHFFKYNLRTTRSDKFWAKNGGHEVDMIWYIHMIDFGNDRVRMDQDLPRTYEGKFNVKHLIYSVTQSLCNS